MSSFTNQNVNPKHTVNSAPTLPNLKPLETESQLKKNSVNTTLYNERNNWSISNAAPSRNSSGLHDFSKLCILSPKQPSINQKISFPSVDARIKTPNEEFQDAPETFEKKETDPLESDVAPNKAKKAKCPEFVSMTAKGKDPELKVVRNKCRFRLGTCTTPRGTCGNTNDSGMAFEAKVNTAAGCSGELAFMQNVLSTERKVEHANGTIECMSAKSAHHDGGPPWKGCKIQVSSAGTGTLESDDCPGRSLQDNPKSVSITDKFKLYLMWKASGSKQGWKPIANLTWSWSGSITRKAGAKNTDDCTKKYKVVTKSHKDGTGKASTKRPVSTPKIKDLEPSPCK